MATPTDGPRLAGSERSIGQLVSDATQEISGIFKSEIELAKTEIKQDVSHAGKGGGMFAGAALFGLFFLGFLLTGIVYLLERYTPMPLWACWLVVAGVLLLLAIILALVGKAAMSKVKGKPEKTIEHGQATVAALKDGQAGGKNRVQTLKGQIDAEKEAKEAEKDAEKARKEADKEADKAARDLEKARKEAAKDADALADSGPRF